METPDQLRELFRMQKALNARIGVHTDAMSETEKTQWILNYSGAIAWVAISKTCIVRWIGRVKYPTRAVENDRG